MSIAGAVCMCRLLEKNYRVGVYQGGIPRVMQLQVGIEDCSTGL